jgi:hypothetical protein
MKAEEFVQRVMDGQRDFSKETVEGTVNPDELNVGREAVISVYFLIVTHHDVQRHPTFCCTYFRNAGFIRKV